MCLLQHRGQGGTGTRLTAACCVCLVAPCRRCLCEWLQTDAISRGLAAAATAGARAAVQAAVAAERHEVRLPALSEWGCNSTGVCALADCSSPDTKQPGANNEYKQGMAERYLGLQDTSGHTALATAAACSYLCRCQVLEGVLPETADDLMGLIMRHTAAGPSARFAAAQLLMIAARCMVSRQTLLTQWQQ